MKTNQEFSEVREMFDAIEKLKIVVGIIVLLVVGGAALATVHKTHAERFPTRAELMAEFAKRQNVEPEQYAYEDNQDWDGDGKGDAE